ncbi:MAG: Ku protein [Pirellulales bacterium]
MSATVLLEAARVSEPLAAPASRASWCGQLRLGTICVPVKAYAAIATPPDTPLRQLHASCGQRIEYRKCCPLHGAVPADEITKGYPYQPDQYIEVSETELEHLQPADEKTIHLNHFVDPARLDLVLFAGRSLYLAPANPAARRPLALVHQALQRSGKWAIGRVVFSGRWQLLAARPEKQVLLVHTLYHPNLRRALVHGEDTDVEIAQQELRPLLRIIDAAQKDIPWQEYQDESERRLTELVAAKVSAAQNPRAARAKGKHRSAAARTNALVEQAVPNGSSRTRRKAA